MPKTTQPTVDDGSAINDEEIIVVDGGDEQHDASSGSDADAGAESLKEQLAAEKKRADESERRAAERDTEARRAEEKAARSQSDLEDSRLLTIQNAIAATEAKRKDLRSRLIAAKSAGDWETETDLSLEVAQVTTEMQRLTEGKNVLENRITEERERAKAPPTPADPLEAAVAKMTPRSANWVRSHPEVVFDPVRNAELVLADKLAQRAGIDPNSDAYYAHMDKQMGYGDMEDRATSRRAAAPAAPVSRGGAMDAPLQQGQVRLSRAEREIADEWGWSYARYAQEKAKIERERGTTH